MSLVINGTPSNSTTPLAATVTAIANNGSGLMRVTTAAPHLFGEGDYANLLIATFSPVSQWYVVHVIDGSTLDLVGSTYAATGTGTIVDYSLSPQILVPTDGDPFSLQLSGMLSGLQALADRTQALRYAQINQSTPIVAVTASGNVPIPPWANYALVDGCGGGGGGGGGPGGFSGVANRQFPAGGGGAGSKKVQGLVFVNNGATALVVSIGAGGVGGAGTSAGASPSGALPGSDGDPTVIAYVGGSHNGVVCAVLDGGAGGGGGDALFYGGSTDTPIFVPGGAGPAGLFRGGPNSQLAPGYRQLQNLKNASGTITASGAWPLSVYTDPVGPMSYSEGGASVSNGNNGTYAAAVSYDGAFAEVATTLTGAGSGGSHAVAGTADLTYPGGAGGGGGGAGPYGSAGVGGAGGNGNHAGSGTDAVAGTAAAANSGAGGGGGGGGGNASGTGGNGKAGGNGGSATVYLIFLNLGVST